jgi:hypothetical protein
MIGIALAVALAAIVIIDAVVVRAPTSVIATAEQAKPAPAYAGKDTVQSH